MQNESRRFRVKFSASISNSGIEQCIQCVAHLQRHFHVKKMNLDGSTDNSEQVQNLILVLQKQNDKVLYQFSMSAKCNHSDNPTVHCTVCHLPFCSYVVIFQPVPHVMLLSFPCPSLPIYFKDCFL